MKRNILIKITILWLFALPTTAQVDKDHNFHVGKNLQIFNEIYTYLDMMYVDTLNAEEVIGNGIKSMLASLDPYTVYYPENKVNDLKTMITGRYVGIGAIIKYNQKIKRIIIDEPYAATPAAEAGLKKAILY